MKKNPDSSLNDITPPDSRSAIISSALPIPLIAFHGSSSFSGALFSVGVGCGVGADGSGFGSVGLAADALSISSCACRLARRAAKNFSTCSAAAFLFAISVASVCVSMKSLTASPSRPQLDRLANGNIPQRRPPLRSGKLTAEKKKPSETLTERFRELVVIQFQ